MKLISLFSSRRRRSHQQHRAQQRKQNVVQNPVFFGPSQQNRRHPPPPPPRFCAWWWCSFRQRWWERGGVFLFFKRRVYPKMPRTRTQQQRENWCTKNSFNSFKSVWTTTQWKTNYTEQIYKYRRTIINKERNNVSLLSAVPPPLRSFSLLSLFLFGEEGEEGKEERNFIRAEWIEKIERGEISEDRRRKKEKSGCKKKSARGVHLCLIDCQTVFLCCS